MSGQTDQSRPVSRVSVVEALTQIRALCDEWKQRADGPWREGDYETASVLVNLAGEVRAVLDAVPVDATRAQGIDRDVRASCSHCGRTIRVWQETWIHDDGDRYCFSTAAEPAALVRPVEGVVLTPEERDLNRRIVVRMAGFARAGSVLEFDPDAVDKLADRLEARS